MKFKSEILKAWIVTEVYQKEVWFIFFNLFTVNLNVTFDYNS
jgi:hypothetical protein